MLLFSSALAGIILAGSILSQGRGRDLAGRGRLEDGDRRERSAVTVRSAGMTAKARAEMTLSHGCNIL